jgi:DNA-binding XRE family transcriptional regulator
MSSMPTTRSAISRLAINDGERQLRRTCARFGEEFRNMRLRAGLSQAAVARAIGVARSVICRIEQGDSAVASRIQARAVAPLGGDFVAAAFPVPSDALMASLAHPDLALPGDGVLWLGAAPQSRAPAQPER